MEYRRQKNLIIFQTELDRLMKKFILYFAEGLDLMIQKGTSSPFLYTAKSIQLEILRVEILQRGIQPIQ